MHPFSWARRCRAGFSSHHHGPEGRGHEGHFGGGHFGHRDEGGFGSGGGFGVRRPLRFLAYKLDLSEQQVAAFARVLDELKTERAQGEVDDRRTLADFADAMAADTFDGAKAGGGADRRIEAARRLREAVLRALGEIHALLTPDQRGRLAYLIRTGVLMM